MKNTNFNINEFAKFASKQDEDYGVSDLWANYINDFDFLNSKAIRPSYKTNKNRLNKRVVFQTKFNNLIIKFINLLFKIIKRISLSFINTITFFGVKNAINYGIYIPNTMFSRISISDPNFKKELDDFHSLHKIFYSFTSVKSFYNFYCFKNYLPVESFNNKNILEIGSGAGLLARIFTSNLESYNYVCLDLPQMIPHAYDGLYKDPVINAEVYLPNQITLFNKSKSKKKILFILPHQLDLISIKFDLLNNIESFGEMPQTTVDNYINSVIPKLNSDAICFLINRVTRCTNLNDPTNHDSWTMFYKYPLMNFEIIVKKIDDFKDLDNPEEKNRCNVFYIGKLIQPMS